MAQGRTVTASERDSMGQVLSLLVENKAGVLSRIVGLFSQRGYNIDSLNVAPTQDPTMSRITLAMATDERSMEQVIKQLNKLIDVVKIIPYDPALHLVREMALVRVRVKEKTRAEILALAEVFRARLIDAAPHSYTFETTGQSEKIDAFIQNVQVYGVQEIHRTGQLAMNRGQDGEKRKSSSRQHAPSQAPAAPILEVKTNHG